MVHSASDTHQLLRCDLQSKQRVALKIISPSFKALMPFLAPSLTLTLGEPPIGNPTGDHSERPARNDPQYC